MEMLSSAAERYESRRGRTLDCRVGMYSDCAVLNLQKPAWKNDGPAPVPHQCGIFFSIWITPKGAERNRAEYNIHASKLRQLQAYRLTSIAFARAFRKSFAEQEGDWANVSTEYGPQTLMQGWFEIDKSFVADAVKLMGRFDRKVAPIIDALLAEAKKTG